MCMTPYPVLIDKECYQDVPCGKCPQCKRLRISAWAFRLMNYERQASSAVFATLTYDTEHVPITQNGFMSLDYRDAALFFKRLRKRVSSHSPDVRIKYYLAGEYGGVTFRPHYHAIIFNVDNVYDIEHSWMRGMVDYGTVTGASINYTLKYIDKPKRIPMHRNDDRLPERSLMSKGLGTDYINEKTIAWHKADLLGRYYLPALGGSKIAMPRYYKEKIYTEEELELIATHYRHRSEDHLSAMQDRYGLDEYERKQQEIILWRYEQFKLNYKKDKT